MSRTRRHNSESVHPDARLVRDVTREELEGAQIAPAALQGGRGPDPAGAGAALAKLFAALELAVLRQRLEGSLRLLQTREGVTASACQRS